MLLRRYFCGGECPALTKVRQQAEAILYFCSSVETSSRQPLSSQEDETKQAMLAGALQIFAFFIFLYFSKSFFIEIYFRFQNLQVYTSAARQGAYRPSAGRPAPYRAVGAYMQLKFMFYRMEAYRPAGGR